MPEQQAEQSDFDALVEGLITGQLNAGQRGALSNLLGNPEYAGRLQHRLEQELASGRFTPAEHNALYEQTGMRIQEGVQRKIQGSETDTVRSIPLLQRYRWAAAAIFVLFITGGFLLLRRSHTTLLSQTEKYKNDVAPGRNGALLSIEGSKTILLDTMANGHVLGHFTKGDSSITVESNSVQYATLSTPAAHTEMLKLQDGTIVYLNASSSIRFPTLFTGDTREVAITGEAYFDVKHKAGMPFKVKLPNGSVLEDIGTAFNVNTYDNEKYIRTTVVEGAVKVMEGKQSLLLKPGSQSQDDRLGSLVLDSHPDMDETLAWKNGLFTYNGVDMETIMRQVARWYGVDIVFKDPIEGSFVADLPRDVPVSKLLTVLEGTHKVHFKIEGKRISVFK